MSRRRPVTMTVPSSLSRRLGSGVPIEVLWLAAVVLVPPTFGPPGWLASFDTPKIALMRTWFFVERTFKKRQRLRGAVRHCRIDVRDSAEREVVGVKVVRPLALDALNLRLAQARLDGGDHAHREFVLDREDVVESAVVTIRPDVPAGFRFDELTGDAHAA